MNLDVWADRGVKHSIKVGDFVPPVGRSSTWIFRFGHRPRSLELPSDQETIPRSAVNLHRVKFGCRAPSRKAASGVGIAKVWCLPFKKQHGIKVDDCIPSKRNDIMSKLAAYTKLARDCGVADVVSSSWVEQVKAIMPGTGRARC